MKAATETNSSCDDDGANDQGTHSSVPPLEFQSRENSRTLAMRDGDLLDTANLKKASTEPTQKEAPGAGYAIRG